MNLPLQQDNLISESDRKGLYKTIFSRRDVRGQFLPDPIPDEVISRILYAAHYAPSVGFMQSWNFIIIKSTSVRKKIHDIFKLAHQEAAEMFSGEKQEAYRSLKLEGILESPLNICITCDKERSGPVVLGRTHFKEMDTYSSVCAIQNILLAARAEGLGVGWVSILHEDKLRAVLNLPDHVVPIGYLCVGRVKHFYQKPELELAGWLPRMPMEDLVYFDQWGSDELSSNSSLVNQIKKDSDFPWQSVQIN
ncbi:MAG: 5,6-dimethylbenzimidazole synthase [Pseudomonadales bacterium]|nr:5,6-dimethylbenzimidazole synthase [Pseudomonadales bacterium]